MKKILFIFILIGFVISAKGQTYKDWLSPLNAKRPYRSSTRYIVLHTTEGADRPSLNTLHRHGTCNYMVATDGTIYTIISDGKVSKHAGRSMWYGSQNLSNLSIGIEIVGYHNKKITKKQTAAIKLLVASLKKKYHLKDEAVVTHSMVAYGSPNQWFAKKHRGRKRCGMLFASASFRTSIGLKGSFSVDPDVKAGRLINADPYLAKVLYGGPTPTVSSKKQYTDPKNNSEDDFEGFRQIGAKGVYPIAGEEYNAKTTIYFFPDTTIRTGKEIKESEFASLPKGTKVLVGYVHGGKVTKSRTAYDVVGKDYNLPSTFYLFPNGKIVTGDGISERTIPVGTILLFRD